MFNIEACGDENTQRLGYVQKAPRFVLQGPRTDVTLTPSPFPELSAIPYLDGVVRHANELLAAKTKAEKNGRYACDKESTVPNTNIFAPVSGDAMIIDRLSMLPQSSRDKLFSQWAQDAIDECENLNKELDSDVILSDATLQPGTKSSADNLIKCVTQVSIAPDLEFVSLRH